MIDWKECTIGHLTSFITKGTTPKKFVDRGINYVKSQSISYDGRIDVSLFDFIDEETNERFKRSQLAKDDILFSMAGVFLGKNAIVPEEILPANTNQALAIIRLNQEIAAPKFIHYFLRQTSIIEYVNSMSGQSAQPNINFQEIKSIEVPLPSLSEQEAIASVLSSLDDKIVLLHRQNKILESMVETLFRQWFVEEVRDDWEEVKLGKLINISSGKSLKKNQYVEGGAYRVLGANGEIGRTDKFLFEENLLFTGRVGTLGNIFRIENEKVWLSDNTLVIKPISYFNFIYLTLKTANLEEYNVGSTQPLIRQTDIKEIEISIPPGKQLDDFESDTQIVFIKMRKNNDQIRTLEKLRDTLLPKLMSGEVRVKFEH